ncbi:Rpn family recombination-promoting nuclease/putative transposase [Microcystis aeruginosa]|uniref:Rpn family recombination-promoting nuclease/putative transposase n=1 Tax=Microcystis aeruginosa TaxID=1126 RepID=UPI0021502198|nr:Rpn family recombination-promoting nuclease/putative transposase [Microcystis aeruginosa]
MFVSTRYGELINSGRILRFYLEELREVESLGISMLQLIVAPTARAIEQGKSLDISEKDVGTIHELSLPRVSDFASSYQVNRRIK